ncbi:MAG: hypothetical protein AB7S55_07650 [Thiomonas sp.]
MLDLLTRADRGAQPALAFEDALAGVFGIEAEDLPWGALGLWGETGARPEGLVMRLDPVHLRLGMTDAVVAGGASLHLSLDEANTLARALEQHFSARGWRIVVAAPERWYVCLDEPVDASFELHTTPLSQALGHDAGVFKPQGRDARRWLADLTEAQMLLFAHPINAAREARGLPVINSLWPWGAGILLPSPLRGEGRGERVAGFAAKRPPQTSEPPLPNGFAPLAALSPRGGREFLPTQFTAVYANHPLARGLAHALELPVYDLAETFEECADLSGTALIVLDDLVQPFQDGDYDDWQATLEGLEARWFAPLRAALAQGRMFALQIDTGAAHFVCKPAHRWRFWRTVKPLESLCSAASV